METQYFATACLGLAIIHTFCVKIFQSIAAKYPEGSALENLFHLLGEVEVVFGVWAGIFVGGFAVLNGPTPAIEYLESLNFTESIFIFAILSICSSAPILKTGAACIEGLSRLLPIHRQMAFWCAALVIGPILGSFITEPAAMTITALLLMDRFFSKSPSNRFQYVTLGILFVNISVGGTLTSFAAPPVLMVAGKWGWDLQFMLTHFGYRAVAAVITSTAIGALILRKEFKKIPDESSTQIKKIPYWVQWSHILFLIAVVATSHHSAVFMAIFLFFLGLAQVTQEFQTELKLKEGLLVAFFLAGLVVLGGPQKWWLEPLIASLDTTKLYLGSALLTSITDNAALTYLGSQVPNLSDSSKYALVAGSVVGGGLTVVANAPNPIGFNILSKSFGPDGISPRLLFGYALLPTLISLFFFWA